MEFLSHAFLLLTNLTNLCCYIFSDFSFGEFGKGLYFSKFPSKAAQFSAVSLFCFFSINVAFLIVNYFVPHPTSIEGEGDILSLVWNPSALTGHFLVCNIFHEHWNQSCIDIILGFGGLALIFKITAKLNMSNFLIAMLYHMKYSGYLFV